MNENKKMTSIARKINISFWFKRLSDVIALDIVLIIFLFGSFFYSAENKVPENQQTVDRGFSVDKENQEIIYTIILEDGNEQNHNLIDYLEPFYIYGIILCGLEAIHLFFSLFNTNEIRKKMKPLNDLAVKAEEISNLALMPRDMSKFENLEHAISNVSTDSSDVSIKTGDKDLQSIEIALNNLLRKMKESELQQTRFVSDASHELRTPISVIQGYVNMLDRWGKEDESVLDESIEALKNESMHMKELIEQLLFLARGDSGRNHLNCVDFDLNNIVYEVWEESIMIDEKHKYTFKSMGQDISYDESGKPIFPEKAMTHGDIAMIKQSIRIFVQNAAKYSKDGDTITFGVNKTDNQICYIIQDEGIGMSESDVIHIFERFYRSDKARNGETGGSGLGLSIAKWIIDAHDGTIEVLSRPDFGSRFTISFNAGVC